MKYNNRFYPHPVLGIRDDIDGSFQCHMTVEVDKDNTIVTPQLKLDNKDLEKLVSLKKASFCIHTYCRGTMFREVFRIKDPVSYKITIPTYKLNGETEMDFFICAEEELNNYSNSGSNIDYKGYVFQIEKGDIIAYGGKAIFYSNKSPEQLKSVSAIMNIKNSGQKNGPFFNEYDGPKITINISDSDYDQYQILKQYKSLIPVIHSSLVFPALYEALNFMEYDEAADQYNEFDWYKLLRKRLEEIKGNTLLEKAQNILDLPINRTFNVLEELFDED